MDYIAEVELTVINCGVCGGAYAINVYRQDKHEKGQCWHCPYCECSWGYSGSEAGRLRKELEQKDRALVSERSRHDQTRSSLKHTEKRLQATRGVVTRTKKRIGKGACPCCNRFFRNMSRHMESQHPTYAESET